MTKANPVVDELHGMKLTDAYQWLEDKTDESVSTWTHAQHDATVDFVNSTCSPIQGLRDELRAYIDRDIISPMSLVADRQFFTMKKKGDAQSKLFTRYKGKDILLFDPEKIDPSGTTSMSGRSYTKKGEKVAVGVQVKGAEIRTYYIIDTKTGKVIGKPIEGLRGFNWTDDEKHAYIWIRTKEMIDAQEPYEIYLHKLGSPRSADQFLLKPTDAKGVASIYDSRWSDLTFYSQGDFYATHSLKMKKTGSRATPVEIYGSKDYSASAYALDDDIYFFTNHEAPNFKLMVTEKNTPEFENWKELVPEGETVIESYAITNDLLLIQDKKDIISRIHAYDKMGKYIKQLPMPEIGNVAFMNYNRDVKKVFVGLTSFATPFKIYSLEPDQLLSDMPDWKLFYEQEVPINTDDVEGKVDFYISKDGTKVPLIIVHKKGMELNGNNPTILYGYGGFNIGMSPSFVGANAMFINRGGVYAIACIRGGDEYGESWHKDGMLFNKQNTFDDFIAAGEYLIDEGYTSSDKLGIMGGSNGGLLVGAVATQRPDLFKMVWCAVPLLDMVRFPKFLIAQYWIPEYGDPEVEADFRNILSYSPYHNIRMGIDHPTMIVTAGENDTRVDPLHAKKFVAALQNNPGQINPIMLYMNFDSGHGSGKSTEQIIDEQEFRWRFIMNQLGMK
jgi:prolyl oligopeptidase